MEASRPLLRHVAGARHLRRCPPRDPREKHAHDVCVAPRQIPEYHFEEPCVLTAEITCRPMSYRVALATSVIDGVRPAVGQERTVAAAWQSFSYPRGQEPLHGFRRH